MGETKIEVNEIDQAYNTALYHLADFARQGRIEVKNLFTAAQTGAEEILKAKKELLEKFKN